MTAVRNPGLSLSHGVPCRAPGGCGNTTKSPDALCYLHRGGASPAGVAAGALPRLTGSWDENFRRAVALSEIASPTAIAAIETAAAERGFTSGRGSTVHDPETGTVNLTLRDREEVTLVIATDRWAVRDASGTEVESGPRSGHYDVSLAGFERAARRAKGISALGRFADRFRSTSAE